ncbi:MAG: thiosulfate oxidation carrier complex protein SoxZ [Methylococcales bacterium]|nr:thiosulfate oxidation carrier complex protein SoxZ [Methylococcales bacterium]MCK5926101.1 thiosulfate oxidation carrier complex protein SoxZ [Methylococcales bacterium]
MKSIKIRTKLMDGKTQVRMLISHPMEHGRRKDKATGKMISMKYIQKLTVKYNDVIVVSTQLGAGVSKDPYFSFMLKGGATGDRIQVTWKDNLGNMDSLVQEIK